MWVEPDTYRGRHRPNYGTETIVNSKNKRTLSLLGFDPDLSGPVGAVFNRTGLACLINSKIHYKF